MQTIVEVEKANETFTGYENAQTISLGTIYHAAAAIRLASREIAQRLSPEQIRKLANANQQYQLARRKMKEAQYVAVNEVADVLKGVQI